MFSPQTQKMSEVMDKTSKSIVAISQCLDISARHAVHLKYKRFLFVKVKIF